MKNYIRPFYKYWPLWLVLLAIWAWPQINDWAWASAKQDAQSLIAQYESKNDAQVAVQANPQAAPAAPAHAVSVEMSKLTCMAANSFYTPYWQMSASYQVKLIQAFVWHGYGIEIPSVQSVKERGCGRADDGKYLFLGN
jgi:hypothetical protein